MLLPSSKKQTNRLTLDDQPEMKACALQKGSMKLTRGQEACKKSQRTGIRSSQGPLNKGHYYHLPSSPPSTTAAQRGVLHSGHKYHWP